MFTTGNNRYVWVILLACSISCGEDTAPASPTPDTTPDLAVTDQASDIDQMDAAPDQLVTDMAPDIADAAPDLVDTATDLPPDMEADMCECSGRMMCCDGCMFRGNSATCATPEREARCLTRTVLEQTVRRQRCSGTSAACDGPLDEPHTFTTDCAPGTCKVIDSLGAVCAAG